MKLLQQLCAEALTFEQYIAQGSQAEQQAVTIIQAQLSSSNTSLKGSIKRLKAFEKSVNLLVVGESFCPDCHVNISAFEFIVLQQSKVKLHLISREVAQEKLLEILPLTEIKIPLLLTLDENYQLIHQKIGDNLFVERPNIVKQIADFNSVKENYINGEYLNDTLEQIIEMID